MSWSAAYTTFSLGESRAAMSCSSVCGGLASSGRAVAKTAAMMSRDLQMRFMLIPFILLVDEARQEILNKTSFCQPRSFRQVPDVFPGGIHVANHAAFPDLR